MSMTSRTRPACVAEVYITSRTNHFLFHTNLRRRLGSCFKGKAVDHRSNCFSRLYDFLWPENDPYLVRVAVYCKIKYASYILWICIFVVVCVVIVVVSVLIFTGNCIPTLKLVSSVEIIFRLWKWRW